MTQAPLIQRPEDELTYPRCTSSLYTPEDEAPEPITTVVSAVAPFTQLIDPRTIVLFAFTYAFAPMAVAFMIDPFVYVVLYPRKVLLLPVRFTEILYPAAYPFAVLLIPVVFLMRALFPFAVLPYPVVL